MRYGHDNISWRVYAKSMDLRQLRAFEQIVRSGSFSAASHVLGIAQPALSRQLQALEHHLGVKLLHRNGRGVAVTEAGEELLAGSRQLLEDAQRLDRRIRNLGTSATGTAIIGLSPTLGRCLTVPLIEKVQGEHPGIRLGIVEAFSGTLREWLQSARIDAAILYHLPMLPGLNAEKVAEEPLAVLSAAASPAFPSTAPVDLRALAGRPIVLPTTHHGLRQMIDEYTQRAGITLKPMLEIDSLEALISIVRKGMALTVLPEAAVQDELNAGRLVAHRIGSPPMTRPLLVVTAAQRAGAIETGLTARLLKDVVQSVASANGWSVSRGAALET